MSDAAVAPAGASSLHVAGNGGKAADAVGGSLAEIISFAIGDDQYGVDIMAVREIKEWSNVTHLRSSPTMCAAS